jgi:malonyl CoA-acyl carrier protein transacylase
MAPSKLLHVRPLAVSAPFHSPLMHAPSLRFQKWILDNLTSEMLSSSPSTMTPIMSTCTRSILHFSSLAAFAGYAQRQIVEPVYWHPSLERASQYAKTSLFFELGSKMLSALNRQHCHTPLQLTSILESSIN